MSNEVWVVCSVGSRWYHFLSQVIMRVEGTTFSHVSLLIRHNGIETVYEAVHPKSQKILFADWLKERKMTFAYQLPTPRSMNEAVKIVEKEIGIRYSFTQLAFILVGKIVRPVDDIKLNNRRGLVCTELVGRFLNKVYGSKFDKSYDSLGLVDIKTEASKLSMKGDAT